MKLVPKKKISRKRAEELVIQMAMYSNHYNPRPISANAVRQMFPNLEHLVEYARVFTNGIPNENLIGPTRASYGGGELSLIDNSTGEALDTLSGPGVLITASYWALFENSYDKFREALASGNYTDFLSAIAIGVASVEAYITHRAELHNRRHPETPLLDSKQSKVPFDQKIDDWIPTMSSGRKLDKGGKMWRTFRSLRDLRDDFAIHVKSSVLGVPYELFLEQANMYRTGIAELLVKLHRLFDDPIPSRILRASFYPDLELVEDPMPSC